MTLAWRSELERRRLRALDKFEPNEQMNGRTDERTEIVTPWAPVGAKNATKNNYNLTKEKTFDFFTVKYSNQIFFQFAEKTVHCVEQKTQWV